jgi:hypothetical protein
MAQYLHYLDDALAFFREGFMHVNATLGLIIALFAAFRLANWRGLWEIALAATLVHIVAEVLIPFLDHGAPIRLPVIVDLAFWRDMAAIYIGYVIIIAAFFFIRTRLLRRDGGRA